MDQYIPDQRRLQYIQDNPNDPTSTYIAAIGVSNASQKSGSRYYGFLNDYIYTAGADLSKLHFVGDTTANYELRAFDPATDMQSLMIKAATIPDLALLIIDPIVNAVAGDSHKNGEVRRALQPVVDFGEKLNCAVLGITHFSKGGQGKEPLERVTR